MKKRITALLVSAAIGASAFVAVTGVAADAATNCRRFRLVTEAMTWDEAYAEARSMGGYLATIGNAREERCVEELLMRVGFKPTSRSGNVAMGEGPCIAKFDFCGPVVWLGGSDGRNEGVWRWLDRRGRGQVFFKVSSGGGRRYTNWGHGLPEGEGDCLAMGIQFLFSKGSRNRALQIAAPLGDPFWMDRDCDAPAPFVVEF